MFSSQYSSLSRELSRLAALEARLACEHGHVRGAVVGLRTQALGDANAAVFHAPLERAGDAAVRELEHDEWLLVPLRIEAPARRAAVLCALDGSSASTRASGRRRSAHSRRDSGSVRGRPSPPRWPPAGWPPAGWRPPA